ncbi:MAG: anti-sigma factor antagonist [Synechococcaceae cyanobacterium SM2_3_2]|nr:anti-sigma factor antagonist [Synechococcaceae cyanobacterium SM2_3_2]
MAFNCTLDLVDSIAKVFLSGELDASAAGQFKAKVEEAAGEHPKKLVLMMQDLEFMASAGLRVLIFARQKMGADVDIYVVGAQEGVVDTLMKTGFNRSVILQETFEE